MSKIILPNFFIVGAAKCGTSSLHHYLRQHPDIFMPYYIEENGRPKKVKEPRYFVKDYVQNRVHDGVWDWDTYVSLFENAHTFKAIGESSVLYLYYYKESIKNIQETIGSHVKIIIMLRNPIDRAVSAYLHTRRGGFVEKLSFEQALKVELDRYNTDRSISPMTLYKQMGLYFDMVQAFKQAFKNVHIIIYDDFKENTENEVNKVFDFLGVDSSFKVDTSKKINTGGKDLNPLVKQVIYGNNSLKRSLSFMVEKSGLKPFFKGALMKFGSKEERFELKPEIREGLSSFFSEDVTKLSGLLNRDLTFWTRGR